VIVLRWAAALGLVLGAGCTCAGRALPAAGGSGSGGASSGTAGATSTTGAPIPDVPSNCHPEAYGECDPWCQDCPEGQKCNLWASDGGDRWDATRCVPVAPNPKRPGEPCTVQESPTSGLDDCEKGATCGGVDRTTGVGECFSMCRGSPDAPECPLGQFCLANSVGDLTVLCRPWCDPFGRDFQGCAVGTSCYLFRNGDWEKPTTFPVSPLEARLDCILNAGGDGWTGAPCDWAAPVCRDRQCVPKDLAGVCTDNPSLEADGCCAAWCDLSAPECPDGGTCQRVFEPGYGLDPIYENLGLCLAP